jgi:hypothetical protein
MTNSSTRTPEPADLNTEFHRQAYNAAFNELGLPWYWDASTLQRLAANPEAKEPVMHYLETQQPHLLKAYDADFLINAIHSTKARCFNGMSHQAT